MLPSLDKEMFDDVYAILVVWLTHNLIYSYTRIQCHYIQTYNKL